MEIIPISWVPPPPEGTEGLVLYREWGYFLKTREMYYQSMMAFDHAIRINPEDVRTLIGRSKMNSAATNYKMAMRDAEAALALDPGNLLAAYQQAQAKYELGDFEQALNLYHRGLRRRKQPPNFAEGVMQCSETIEDCIGYNVGSVLKDFEWTITAMDKFRISEAERLKNLPEETCVEETDKEREERLGALIDAQERHRLEVLGRVMAEKYLGRLAHEKYFLRTLISDYRLPSANKTGGETLKQLCVEAFQALQNRQEVLRTRRPWYSVKYRDLVDSERIRMKKKQLLERSRAVAKIDAEKFVTLLRQARQDRNIKFCLETIDRAKVFMDSKTKKSLPNKKELMDTMYNIAGLTYLQMYRINPDMGYEANKRVQFLFGQMLHSLPTEDSIIDMKFPYVDYKKAIRTAETRADLSADRLERAFYFHELGRYYMEIHKYDMAKMYAKKSMNDATFAKNYAWVVNAAITCARADIMVHNRNDAKKNLQVGLDAAYHMRNDTVIEFIEQCISHVESVDFADMITEGGVEQREKQIVDMMMGTGMKEEAESLFRRMSALPANRRLSVMPGVKAKDEESRDAKTKPRKSIMPPSVTQVKDKPDKKKPKGYQEFDL
ncbi:tetratricopeptide repeat protein 25-like [Ctenocephalides felis]|uniref:tetratricopeptide repeat protein 25-like n=1 Tax=Ctenocephalides felis TaxID=7515 RepID=UPI000E6E54A6|nr:tetratricopeptide repeat protein 25-like [Ctenocephalides felis]